MKISELIKELPSHQDEFGDLDVVTAFRQEQNAYIGNEAVCDDLDGKYWFCVADGYLII